jgi:hypothetical protein
MMTSDDSGTACNISDKWCGNKPMSGIGAFISIVMDSAKQSLALKIMALYYSDMTVKFSKLMHVWGPFSGVCS